MTGRHGRASGIVSRGCTILFAQAISRQRRGSGTGFATHAHRIKARWSTELAPVLPAELGRTVVPDAVADAGDVVRAVRQQQSRRLQPDMLLKLDRGHRRYPL